jgi:AraC-like DNA-binding protein
LPLSSLSILSLCRRSNAAGYISRSAALLRHPQGTGPRTGRGIADPLQDSRAIGTIAYEAGFGDLSYFNRAFRRRYGATPSNIRETDR